MPQDTVVRPRRILLVEDDTELRLAIVRSLRKISPTLEIDAVVSADEAFSRFRGDRQDVPGFDLVISDVVVPGERSGLDLWAFCQKRWPATPFILVSGISEQLLLKELGPTDVRPTILSKTTAAGIMRKIIADLLALEDPHPKTVVV